MVGSLHNVVRMALRFKWVLLTGLVLRVLWVLFAYYTNGIEGWQQYDSTIYQHIAETYDSTRTMGYSNDLIAPIHNRVPGYPFLIHLFGPYFLIALQIFMSCLTILISARLAEHLGLNGKLSQMVGWLLALDVPSILFSGSMMTESLFTFLLVASVFIWITRKNLPAFAISGMMIGLAAYLRPIALFIPVIFLGYELIFHRTVKRTLAITVCFLLLISPWIVRNGNTFGQYFFSSVSTTNLCYYRAAGITSVKENQPLGIVQADYRTRVAKSVGQIPTNQDSIYDYLMRKKAVESELAWDTIQANPGIYTRQSLTGATRMLFYPVRAYVDYPLGWQPTSKVSWTLVVAQFIQLTLVYLGIMMLILRRKWRTHHVWLAILVIGYFVLLSAGVEADARFRIPIMPMLIILSALGYQRNTKLKEGMINESGFPD